MCANWRPVQFAIAFETNDHPTAQLPAGLQKFRRRIPAICDEENRMFEQRQNRSQWLAGDFHGTLSRTHTLLIQNIHSTTGCLRQEHHGRELPPDAHGFAGMLQVRDVDHSPVCTGVGLPFGRDYPCQNESTAFRRARDRATEPEPSHDASAAHQCVRLPGLRRHWATTAQRMASATHRQVCERVFHTATHHTSSSSHLLLDQNWHRRADATASM